MVLRVDFRSNEYYELLLESDPCFDKEFRFVKHLYGALRYLLFPHQTGWSPDCLLAELLQPSILVFVSTIYAVLSKNFGAVMKFMLELVALSRRIIHVFGNEDLSPQVICASERSTPAFRCRAELLMSS